MKVFGLLALLLLTTRKDVYSFLLSSPSHVSLTSTILIEPTSDHGALFMSSSASSSRRQQSKESDSNNFLLDDFKTASGEIINPYIVLKVSRTSTKDQIRRSYILLSKRYHPDSVRHRDILPGSCNNLSEVRDHWERISLSYRILSNQQSRNKYDRHEALADPGSAMKRAVVNAAFDSMKHVGKGLFSVTTFAFQKMVNGTQQMVEGTQQMIEKSQNNKDNNNKFADATTATADAATTDAATTVEMNATTTTTTGS